MNHEIKSWLQDLLLITAIIGILFGIYLGTHPLMVPDEGRYAEIPREMIALGNYLTPHLNYIKYFEKPPLFYWLQTISIHWFGLNLWSLRLATALLGLVGCLLTYATTRKLFDRTSAWLASLILATSCLYFALAHFIATDMTLAVMLSGCLFSFLLANQASTASEKDFYLFTMYVCAALATLTKGLIGFLLPGAIILIWIILFNEWRQLKTYRLVLGSALFLLITLPWHILAQSKNPEFFHFYFIDQHLLRYFTPYAKREQAFGFLPATLVIGFFPWIAFLPQAIKSNLPKKWSERGQYKESIFFLLWATGIFCFFWVSNSLLIAYLLPIFPPLAILAGRYLANELIKSNVLIKSPINRNVLIGFLIILLGTVTTLIVISLKPPTNISSASLYSSIGLFSATVLCTILLYAFKNLRTALIVFLIGLCATLIIIYKNYPDNRNATYTLATQLAPLLGPEDEVISYHQYYQDLPVYLQRRITVIGSADELKFGMQHQDTHSWMISDAQGWQRWNSPQKLFMVLPEEDYKDLLRKQHMILLAQTSRNVLVTNH